MPADAFFVGAPGEQIFCRLDRPSSGLVRDAGILICHSLGPEYYRSYRILGRLAEQLAELGFPVLRFDYPGTGDSEQRLDRLRLCDWTEAVRQAANELLNRGGVSHLVLIGLRFGAMLALLAAQQLGRVDTLVLWDPVTDGRGYVSMLRGLHKAMLRDPDRFRRPRLATVTADTELLGANYAAQFLADVAAIDADALFGAAASQTVVLSARRPADGWPATRANHLALQQDYGWTRLDRMEESIMDPAATRLLSQHLRTLHA